MNVVDMNAACALAIVLALVLLAATLLEIRSSGLKLRTGLQWLLTIAVVTTACGVLWSNDDDHVGGERVVGTPVTDRTQILEDALQQTEQEVDQLRYQLVELRSKTAPLELKLFFAESQRDALEDEVAALQDRLQDYARDAAELQKYRLAEQRQREEEEEKALEARLREHRKSDWVWWLAMRFGF